MSAASLILRIVFATVIVITLGVTAVFGFTVIEPFYGAFGEPPSSLGWGTPATGVLAGGAAAFLGLFLVVIIWFIYAPIRRDQRQQYRP